MDWFSLVEMIITLVLFITGGVLLMKSVEQVREQAIKEPDNKTYPQMFIAGFVLYSIGIILIGWHLKKILFVKGRSSKKY
jgi:hypothetical protein